MSKVIKYRISRMETGVKTDMREVHVTAKTFRKDVARIRRHTNLVIKYMQKRFDISGSHKKAISFTDEEGTKYYGTADITSVLAVFESNLFHTYNNIEDPKERSAKLDEIRLEAAQMIMDLEEAAREDL